MGRVLSPDDNKDKEWAGYREKPSACASVNEGGEGMRTLTQAGPDHALQARRRSWSEFTRFSNTIECDNESEFSFTFCGKML